MIDYIRDALMTGMVYKHLHFIPECGLPNRDSRILGGSILDPHEFPWLAILYIKSTIPITGTLLNDRYIISAATPFIGYVYEKISFCFDIHNYSFFPPF
jgi:hypothetical protein